MTSRRQQKQHRRCNITEENVIDYLNDYFEKFQSDLKQNNISQLSTRLPVFIAEKFNKFFELWDENKILERSIDKKIFEKVYSAMSNTFDDRSNENQGNALSNNVLLECKSCGEEITFRNNNLRYSYDFHETTREHLEFMKFLKIKGEEEFANQDAAFINKENLEKNIGVEIGNTIFTVNHSWCNLCNVEIPATTAQNSELRLALHVKLAIHNENLEIFRRNQKFVKTSAIHKNHDITFSCMLCDVTFSVNELIAHFRSKDHQTNELEKSFVEKFDIDCVMVLDDTIGCRLCRVKFGCEKDFIAHVTSSNHRSSVELFRLNFRFNIQIEGQVLRCRLCDERYTEIVDLLKHCRKSTHLDKFSKFLLSVDENVQNLSEENQSLIDIFVTEIPCPRCLVITNGISSLFIHFELFHGT